MTRWIQKLTLKPKQVAVLASVLLIAGCQAPISNTTKTTPKPGTIAITRGAPTKPAMDHHHDHEPVDVQSLVGTPSHFNAWLARFPAEAVVIKQYQAYLASALNTNELPPMNQLLTTARAWQECGYEPYQVPPRELWGAMLPTLRLYHTLKSQGILPPQTQIRSVYRSPALNACAGGAPASKHLSNAAIDIWVPDYPVGSAKLSAVQDNLCRFWQSSGEALQFGLGIYATGAIHLDTQGYRRWGAQYTGVNSPCQSTP